MGPITELSTMVTIADVQYSLHYRPPSREIRLFKMEGLKSVEVGAGTWDGPGESLALEAPSGVPAALLISTVAWLESAIGGRGRNEAVPPAVFRRSILLQATRNIVFQAFEKLLNEGTRLATDCVVIVDPNQNALGMRLIEVIEADEKWVAEMKVKAARNEANAYFNTAAMSELAPVLRDLKIEVDASVRDDVFASPIPSGFLRVLVCTENGASTIDQPVTIVGPSIGSA